MPTKVISYNDATVTVHAPIFGGAVTVDVECRDFKAVGISTNDFAKMIYPSISALASPVPGSQTKSKSSG
jgi:hypothetical protein